MDFCFWCALPQPRNPHAHLIPGSSENAFYAPCVECEDEMAHGVTIVEVLAAAADQKGLLLDVNRVVYPSGYWVVAPTGWLEHHLGAKAQSMMTGHGFCFVDPGTWDLLKLKRIGAEVVEV